MDRENVFVLNSSTIKYGPGATQEVGYNLKALGAKRVLILVDPHLVDSDPVSITLDSLRRQTMR